MSVTSELMNVTVDGNWIEGDIVVHVDEFGFKHDFTQHFKTLKDTDQDINLPGDIKLKLKGTLKPPNQVCISGRIEKGFFGFDIPERCVAV